MAEVRGPKKQIRFLLNDRELPFYGYKAAEPEPVEKIEFQGYEFKIEGSLLGRVIRLSRTQSAKIIARNADQYYWLVELENHSDTETGYRIATDDFVRESLCP